MKWKEQAKINKFLVLLGPGFAVVGQVIWIMRLVVGI